MSCEGSHPAPWDEECPFTARRAPATRRVTWQTRRTPSLSPPPPPKRGRGGRQGRCSGGRTAHQSDDSPASPDAARNQPDPPQTLEPPAPRAPSMQSSVVIQPADRQAAAIQLSLTSSPGFSNRPGTFRPQPQGTGKRIGRR